MNESPKRNILWRIDVICQNRFTGSTRARDEETKKRKKERPRKKRDNGKLGIR